MIAEKKVLQFYDVDVAVMTHEDDEGDKFDD